MLCYCCCGYNEGDDLLMINFYMYDVVDIKCGVCKSYIEVLIGCGDILMKEVEDVLCDYQGQLEWVFNEVCELEKYGVQLSELVEFDQMIFVGLVIVVDKLLLVWIGDVFFVLLNGFIVYL